MVLMNDDCPKEREFCFDLVKKKVGNLNIELFVNQKEWKGIE